MALHLALPLFTCLGCPAPHNYLTLHTIEITPQPSSKSYNTLLNNYQKILTDFILPDGCIDLEALKQDPDAQKNLNAFLAAIGPIDSPNNNQLPDDSQAKTAFHLNAWNAATLRAALEIFPLDSSIEIPDNFFYQQQFLFGNQPLSLDQLAQLCKKNSDWRIPFALGVPFRGGPMIRREIYSADQLSTQLDNAVADYLGSCSGLQIDYASRQVLFGREIYNINQFFIQNYCQKYQLQSVSLISALIPLAHKNTQQQMVELVGLDVAPLPWDSDLNVYQKYPDEYDQNNHDGNGHAKLPCGIK
ncbi:MAG: DUF547 domain-containing protein [Sedimentisphaerales bacterium]|nr:DUF547 domain-containing protein [Sedimentisphaerales bacterium]